jgi:hypothetical protein
MPLWTDGTSGTAKGYAFTAPSMDLGSHPDTLSDARVGLDVRLLGEPDGPYRLGVGADLYVPNGERSDDTTDDTYRAMLCALFAGDAGAMTYAAHVGVHVRPRDDAPVPESPAGSELLFGVAAGPRLGLGRGVSAVIGPEIFGESALHDFLAEKTTGVEALAAGRVEAPVGPADLHVKVGGGGGLNARFGAPEWRAVLSLEVLGHAHVLR